MDPSWNTTKLRLRSHAFRVWTAAAVLAAYIYGWFYAPEKLTWWKRTTTTMVESACGLLPYPWGDRIEATLGNFGLWVQITLAIVVFRILMWLLGSAGGWVWRRRTASDRRATESVAIEDRSARPPPIGHLK